jgi:hypothetical protein
MWTRAESSALVPSMNSVPHDEATKGNATACTVKSTTERLVRVLDILKEKAGCKTPSIKNISASINRKERAGKLPPNKGFAFAVSEARTALRMAELAGFPCRSEFAERQMEAATDRAEKWINNAIA